MDEKNKSKILENFEALTRGTDMTKIMPALRQLVVMDEHEPNIIQNIVDEYDKSKYFYTLILSGAWISFDSLMNVLEKTAHDDLVNLLTDEDSEDDMANLHPLAKAQGIRCVPNLKKKNSKLGSKTKQVEEVKPLNIVVQKATIFLDNIDDGPAKYPMRSRNRAVYLIINNIKFDGDIYPERFGAETDHKNLLKLFNQMQFKGEEYKNLTRDEMIKVIMNFSQSKLIDKTDCCIIVIMSHGIEQTNKSFALARDNHLLDLTDIKDSFNNVNCEKLHNVPKIFIFQCCRGTEADKAVIPQRWRKNSENVLSTDGQPSEARLLPTYSDMLLCFSTVTGFASFRESLTGTWYIETVCDVWSKFAYKFHVEELMKIVQEKIQTKMTKDNEMQTTIIKNIAFRTCYLHPGLYSTIIH